MFSLFVEQPVDVSLHMHPVCSTFVETYHRLRVLSAIFYSLYNETADKAPYKANCCTRRFSWATTQRVGWRRRAI
jgi:hypothetical protein